MAVSDMRSNALNIDESLSDQSFHALPGLDQVPWQRETPVYGVGELERCFPSLLLQLRRRQPLPLPSSSRAPLWPLRSPSHSRLWQEQLQQQPPFQHSHQGCNLIGLGLHLGLLLCGSCSRSFLVGLKSLEGFDEPLLAFRQELETTPEAGRDDIQEASWLASCSAEQSGKYAMLRLIIISGLCWSMRRREWVSRTGLTCIMLASIGIVVVMGKGVRIRVLRG
ncbi:hypothetical protein KCU74_g36, partial [Aureobasidium melanogenum]